MVITAGTASHRSATACLPRCDETGCDVKYPAVGSLVLLLVACGGSFGIVEHHDPVANCWKITMDNNVLPKSASSPHTGERVEFNVQRSLYANGDITYQFIVEFYGTSWMNIRSGMSLFVTADGTQYQLSTAQLPGRFDESSGRVSEHVVYDVGLEDLLAICRAGGVRIRVIGTSSYIEAELSEKNLARLRDFCNQYVVALPYG